MEGLEFDLLLEEGGGVVGGWLMKGFEDFMRAFGFGVFRFTTIGTAKMIGKYRQPELRRLFGLGSSHCSGEKLLLVLVFAQQLR